jgi:nucleotide-binding universal stress UspA family protein
MPQFTEMRRPVLWDDRRAGPGRTVVLGYDGSERARSAALQAAGAAGIGGRILILTSVPSPDADEHYASQVEGAARLLEEAEALLADDEVEVETRLAVGDPVEALVAAAFETGADLIVVGARGRSFLERTLRGSVAVRLVARASCPVLVTP